jgi:cell volume regulation protein A
LDCLKIPGLELFQLVRHGQRYAPADSLFFQESDVLWMICEPGHTERLADFFSHRDRSGELANRSFFGEFVIGGDSSAADLARSYGVALSDQQMGCTIGELIRLSKGRRIVVGDRVALGPIRLTVRTMEGSRILTVGLKV